MFSNKHCFWFVLGLIILYWIDRKRIYNVYVSGDYVGSDKVGGDKVSGDKTSVGGDMISAGRDVRINADPQNQAEF